MIYFMVVAAPPFPEYKGCFVTSAGQEIVFLWVLLLVWDARKCNCIIKKFLPLIEITVLLMLMLVPAMRACEQS